MKHIVILGAGISGLSAAWFLKDRAKITILEKSSRIGGLISTHQKEGFLFDEGPRGFLSRDKGQTTLNLVHELGLHKELIIANDFAKTRYLFHHGKLQPLNFFFLLKMNMLKLGLREWHLKSSSQDDESIGAFFSRRFSPKIVDCLIDPMVKGIYGGDPYQLSMQCCFPQFLQSEQKYGSVTKGFFHSPKQPSLLYSFQNGMETLPKKLGEMIPAEICLNATVKSLQSNQNTIVVHTESCSYEADHVIAAIPSKALASLIPNLPLPTINHLTLTTVHLGFSKSLLKHKGFGYLVPSQEKESILGMTWDSQIFARNPNQTIICVMISGNPDHPEMIAKDALRRHLKIDNDPDHTHVHTAHQAIAQYPVGYREQLQTFSHPRLTLLGTSYHGPGVNDCIFQASKLI